MGCYGGVAISLADTHTETPSRQRAPQTEPALIPPRTYPGCLHRSLRRELPARALLLPGSLKMYLCASSVHRSVPGDEIFSSAKRPGSPQSHTVAEGDTSVCHRG